MGTGEPNGADSVFTSDGAASTGRKPQMLAVVPLMMLGLLAAACLVSSADWRGSGSISLLGAGEEAAAAHAITTAAAIDPDSVTAKNPPVDEKIMKEVEKAEQEQAHEMGTEKQFALGKEAVSDDGSGKKIKTAKKSATTKSLLKSVWPKKK